MATITMTKCANISKTFKVRKRRSGSNVQDTPSTSAWLSARTPSKKTPNKTPRKDVFGSIQLESDNEVMWNYELHDLGIDFMSTQDDSQDTSNKGNQNFSVWVHDRQSDSKQTGNGDDQRCIPVPEAGTAIADMYNILNNLKHKNGSEDTKRSPNVIKKSTGFGAMCPTPGNTITRCKSDCTPTREKQVRESYWSDDESDGFRFMEDYLKSIEVAQLTNSTQHYSQTAPKNGPPGNRKCSDEDIKRKREAAIQKRKESLSKSQKSQSQSIPNYLDAYKKAEIERKRLAAIQLRKQKLQRRS